MATVPYMAATLIYHSKVQLLHKKTEAVAIAEAKVWKVPKSKDYPDGVKYTLFLVLKETGETIIGFDNHKPKGHHFHKGSNEERYNFVSQDALVVEFWDLVKKEEFVL